jgi:DNA-binding transcriptional MerR regulator
MDNSFSHKLFTIGEFSKITGLTIKTLHLYHAKELIIPAYVDSGSGYRYYNEQCIEKAFAIIHLKSMKFTLEQIREILTGYDDQSDILNHLEEKKQELGNQLSMLQDSVALIEKMLKVEKEAKMADKINTFEVEEKKLETILIAGIRMKGRYEDCKTGFSQLGRSFGRYINGHGMNLLYDQEYKEDDAEFEPAFPISKEKQVEGIFVRELPGGKCFSLMHKGPYNTIGRSYAKILGVIKEKNQSPVIPSREIYIKGPGMIFKGNPKKYLTEIQILVEE